MYTGSEPATSQAPPPLLPANGGFGGRLLTRALVHVRVADSEVALGAGREADADLADVVALQQDEEAGQAPQAAVVLGAQVAPARAGGRDLRADCGRGQRSKVRQEEGNNSRRENTG